MPDYSHIPAQGDTPGKALIIIEWAAVIIMLGSLALRFLSRRVQGQKPRFDDWACAFSAVFVIFLTMLGTISVSLSGLGQDSGVTPDSFALTFKLYAPKEICWSFANTSVKLSFLAFFLHVFNLQRFRVRFFIAGALVVALGLGNLIQSVAMCRPFAYMWDKTIPGGVCGNQDLALLLVAVLSVIVDVVIFMLPVPILWGLNIDSKKRRSLVFIFCMGICVTIIPIVRVGLTVPLWVQPEQTTFWVGIIEIFYQLELSLSVIAACIPACKPLLNWLNQGDFRTGGGSSGGGGNRKSEYGNRTNFSRRTTIRGSRFVMLADSKDDGASGATKLGSIDKDKIGIATDKIDMASWERSPTLESPPPLSPPPQARTIHNGILVTTSWDVVESSKPTSEDTYRE